MENVEQIIQGHDQILNSTHYGVTGSHEEPETGYVGRGCSNFCEVDDYGQVPNFSDGERAKAKQGLIEIAENESVGMGIRDKAYAAAGMISEWKLTGRLINQVLAQPITKKKMIPENGDGHSHDDTFTETYKVLRYKHAFPKNVRTTARNNLNKLMDETKDEKRREYIQKTLKRADFLDKDIRDIKIMKTIKWVGGLGLAYFLCKDCGVVL